MSYKFRILMTQAEIADAVGCSQAAISQYLKGDRVPSVKRAKALEQATGICREAWLWPERHWNPYQPFASAKHCFGCTFRGVRTRKVMELAVAHFKQARDKKAAFRELEEIGTVMSGYNDDVILGFKEMSDDSRPPKKPAPDKKRSGAVAVPVHEQPQLAWFYRKEQTIVSSPFPCGLKDDGSDGFQAALEFGQRIGIKSLFVVCRGTVGFSAVSLENPISYSPQIVKASEQTVAELDRIWREDRHSQSAEKRKD